MYRYWLLFAQTVTVCLGILFIVTTLRPDWLQSRTVVTPGGGSLPPAVGTAPTTSVPVAAAAGISYADAVARAAPAVVNIYTRKRVRVPLMPLPEDPELQRLFRDLPGLSRRQETTSLGSGVIMRADGYILTNYHVVEAADTIEVALADGRQAVAVLAGADPESDLAVLRIDLPGLAPIAYDPQVSIRTGDVVLAIGNPFGVGQTITMGIISAQGRNRLGINLYEDFIQTDAAINPGNSGGALIDTQGRLVGINTAIYSETGGSLGIGFAIPAPAAQVILAQVIEHGEVRRGWLGIEPQDITPELARAFGLKQRAGVIIAGVMRDGPAWRAGLRAGDIILTLNEQPVHDAIDLLGQVAPLGPGSPIRLTLLREGKERTVEVIAGLRPPAAQMDGGSVGGGG